MFVVELRERLQAIVAGLDPDVLDPAEAERLVGGFATIEHVAAAGKALVARRVADSGRWQRSGERSEADWLAKQTGESVGAARAALDTAKKVKELGATNDALRKGALSPAQAEAIASAAAADPGAEQGLLGMAGNAPLTKLRDECTRVRAAAIPDPEERRKRIHKSRFFRRWTDAEGARHGHYKLTPENAAVIEGAIKSYAEAAFNQARKEGRHKPSEAYDADGLVAMAADRAAGTTEQPKRAKTETIVLVNAESLRRGTTQPGESCEIAGIGPVSVETARKLLGDSILKLVIRDGIDIRTVVHLGRHPNAFQRTAIVVRDTGRCVRPTCRCMVAEIDHTTDWADTKQTTLDQLAGLCHHDHDLKTHHGHTYQHGPRGWEWHHPDSRVDYEHSPPNG